ncbi:hypothetical protein EV127DRAFT_251778 [Xylaria flabelliformis]|nr:hypothetical protein EV127DRAFT_251778 [Xylaria flabelliformis]
MILQLLSFIANCARCLDMQVVMNSITFPQAYVSIAICHRQDIPVDASERASDNSTRSLYPAIYQVPRVETSEAA